MENMVININRDDLLKSLQQVSGVVERRQTLPILANVLFNIRNNTLFITATDLEVELKTQTEVQSEEDIDITIPARKLHDICKALPDGSSITINVDEQNLTLKSGRGRYTLGTLPAQDFPSVDPSTLADRITVNEKTLKFLIDKTQFAMAQQDVRYYLNGMLFDLSKTLFRTVATDGHRLALSQIKMDFDEDISSQIILPRKAIIELSRILTDSDDDLIIEIGSNHIRINFSNGVVFVSKLIDGRFPDYQRVMPSGQTQIAIANRQELKQALLRASILSNEKYRGIRFKILPNSLELLAHNPEQEEAEEVIEVNYDGPEMTIGFNVGYLTDVLNVIDTDSVEIALVDSNSSCLVTAQDTDNCKYVVMPMRL
jgi:DNA polymerase-3 subunit beta